MRFAYLFGSRASGSAGPRSDVDVAVWLSEPRESDADLDVAAAASRALKRDDVDVVVLNDAPLALAFEALKGRLLLARDHGERVEIEAAIMLRDHDRVPYMRRYLDAARVRLEERGLG